MSYEASLGLYLTAYDQASSVIASVSSSLSQVDSVTQKVTTSTGNMGSAFQSASRTVDTATKSFSDQVVQANSLALAGATLFMSFERVENSEVALDRANLNVQKSTNALTSAQNAYNKALAGGDPQAIADALARLNTAQDALTVSQERVGVAQNNLNNSMIYAALTVVPSFLTMSKALDISMKTLAIDAGAAFGAFAIGYTVLNSIPEPMRTTAAVIAVVTGALVAAAIAAYAFWEGISLTTATPMIVAGIAAIGVAASGLTVLVQNATSAANNFSASLSTLATATDLLTSKITAENTAYQTDLTNMSAYWDTKLGITKTALETIQGKINTYYTAEETLAQTAYQTDVDAANAAYQQQLTDYSSYWTTRLGIQTTELTTADNEIESHYNQQISDTNAFYDDLVAATMTGLNNIRAQRNGNLDDLEENMLSQKISLEDEHDHGLITDAEYQKQLNDINTKYNDNRSRISDRYRLQELQAEKEQTAAAVPIEQDRANAIVKVEYERNDDLQAAQAVYAQITTTGQQTLNTTLIQLASSLAATTVAIENQKNLELQTAYNESEQLAQTHQNNMSNIAIIAGTIHVAQTAGIGGTVGTTAGDLAAAISTGYAAYTSPQELANGIKYLAQLYNLNYQDAIEATYILAAHKGWTPQNIASFTPLIPHFKEGAIVENPTYALLGEAGPEAVIPLGRSGEGYGAVTYNISISVNVEGSVDQRTLAVLREELKNVVVEATSSGASATRKKIRFGNRRSF
jgi:hypothetical protein